MKILAKYKILSCHPMLEANSQLLLNTDNLYFQSIFGQIYSLELQKYKADASDAENHLWI